VQLYREQSQFIRGSLHQQKTNLFVSGLPNGVTDADVRAIFQEFGPIRSVLIKCPVMQNELTKHITQMLPIYSCAYVNFETEEAAQAAFSINSRDPLSQIKVAYYDRSKGQSNVFAPASSEARGSTNYRVLFISKLNRRVSGLEPVQIGTIGVFPRV